jgi:hypothetical protein
MQLIEINKARYRRHLNIVIVACIGCMVIGSLAFSQTLIALFPSENGSHFYWNLLGVILAGAMIAWILQTYRTHDFMTEVVYVWELKQALNKINRKLSKLKAAALEGNPDALLALHYSYQGSRLLWQLDDNTILIDELVIQQAELDSLATRYNFTLVANKYDDSILKQF